MTDNMIYSLIFFNVYFCGGPFLWRPLGTCPVCLILNPALDANAFRSSCGRPLEMDDQSCNSPRSSLIFTSIPPAFIYIVAFEVLNVLSFFFVILSLTQSRPPVERSVANSTNMRCPISSRSKMCVCRQFFSH